MCEGDIDSSSTYTRAEAHIYSFHKLSFSLLDNPSPYNNCYFLIISLCLPFFSLFIYILFREFAFLCLFRNWKEDASFYCCCCRHNMILNAINEHFCILFAVFFCAHNCKCKIEKKGKQQR